MSEIKWHESMQRTYEYYKVDPITWADTDLISTVTSSIIHRDLDTNTMEYLDIMADELYGEFYVRIYMVIFQNGYQFRLPPLGTFLVQSPSYLSDGKRKSISATAYSPLLELSENQPGPGYTIYGESNILSTVKTVVEENTRLRVVDSNQSLLSTDQYSAYISNTEDDWLTYLSDLLSYVDYRFGLDGKGSVLLVPNTNISDMQPSWTYSDDEVSILYPDITIEDDVYNIPNVVEVVASNANGYVSYYAENNDPASITSILNRGRRIIHRISAPETFGIYGSSSNVTTTVLQDYAKQYLRSLSTVTCKMSYEHAYCPVTIGDCVEMNYKRGGITGVKMKVISQSISCTPDAKVSEVAEFSKELWGGN